MPLAPGTRLGPYEIVAPLGAGGMGEVYRARDARLGRDVAVKVLPPHLSASHEVRARFEREARTASSLSHPHICTIFDVGRDGDVDFLVMELVEGETLAQRLARGPLATPEVLRLGGQIADALDRAHRAGVVHRDLKPGNVMLTRAGAKLMDFGLARSIGPAGGSASGSAMATLTHSPTAAAPLTAEGTVVGTVQYMAPEQLEGKEADARSDLWALGCVLYEMATGARAFEGGSQASLIAAIMREQPRPLCDLMPVTPRELDRVVHHCLQKDPDMRFQSARDVVFVLELAASTEARPAAGAAAPGAGRARSGATLALATAAAIALGVAGFFAGRATAPPSGEGAIRVSTLSQGTRDVEPAVSPDGRLVAFTSSRQNGRGLWVMDMVSRGEVKLTGEDDHTPRFSADGSNIFFTRTREGRLSLWRIPVLGGTARQVLEDAFDSDPAPDGQTMAFVAGSSDTGGVQAQLRIAKLDGTGARTLWTVPSAVISSPRWSPDGRDISVTISGGQNAPNRVAIVEVATGKAREFPSPNLAVLSATTWDGTGRGLIVAEGAGLTAIQRGAAGRLYRLDAGSGAYRPLGWIESFPSFLELLPDGRLVLSSFTARQNLLEARLDARTLADARPLTSGMAIDRQPVYSPDGKSVMFSSNRGGSLDLWEVSVETGEMHRVTDDPADDWDPEYAPDGESIAWCSGRSGAFEIWTARRDGSAPRQVSRDGLDAENPSMAPGKDWLVYSSSNPAKYGLWRVPAAGGEGEHLLHAATLIPDLSPDGRLVSVIEGVGTPDAKLAVIDLETRRALPAPVSIQTYPGTVQAGRSRFSSDGAAVVYISARSDGHPVLLRRPVSAWRTGAGRVDTLFPAAREAIESFGFAPDGRRVVVSAVDWLSGLTVTEPVAGLVPRKRAN